MDTTEQFEKFYENIKLTKNQRDDVKTKYRGVCKKLHDNYYSGTEYDGKTKLLIGSYAKHTHIRPARDVDVIFIMPPEKFKQYDDNENSNCQSQLLQDVKKILEEKYPNTPIKADEKVVALQFADIKHDVELLPAWENADGTFMIPNSKNNGSWETWNPRLEIQKIKDSSKKTGVTKKLIRMVKKWSDNCSVKIKSYKIENCMLDFLESYDLKNSTITLVMRDYFEFASSNEKDDGIKTHLNTAYNRAKRACEFVAEDKNDDATEEWKKIFGNDFPKMNCENKHMESKPIVNPPKPWRLN